jgi:hypothetical protein
LTFRRFSRYDYDDLKRHKLTLDGTAWNARGMNNLVLGAVTCAGKLSLLVEYAEQAVDTETTEKVKEQAVEFLLNE